MISKAHSKKITGNPKVTDCDDLFIGFVVSSMMYYAERNEIRGLWKHSQSNVLGYQYSIYSWFWWCYPDEFAWSNFWALLWHYLE